MEGERFFNSFFFEFFLEKIYIYTYPPCTARNPRPPNRRTIRACPPWARLRSADSSGLRSPRPRGSSPELGPRCNCERKQIIFQFHFGREFPCFRIPKYRIVLLLLLGLRQFQRGLEGSALLSKRQQLELLASEPVLQLGLLNPNVDIAEVKKKRMKRI